ncbi:MAG: glycosidase, partial [Syntrophomonas sp.]
MSHQTVEAVFDDKINEIISGLDQGAFDLVIGIPFYNEKEILPLVLKSLDEVLQSWVGNRQLIVCAGDNEGQEMLELIKQISLKHPHIEYLMPLEANGRGMSIRTFLEISKRLEADLLIFSANMITEDGKGMEPAWLENMLTPIQGHYDMVIGSLRRHLGMDSIAHMLAAPILESFYGSRVGDPLGGIYAISHDFVEELAQEAKFWGHSISGFGIDFWLITRALCWNKNICEVNMGGMVIPHSLKTRNRIFSQIALAIFEGVKRDSAIWLQDRLVIKVVDILARSEVNRPDVVNYSVSDLLESFKKGLKENERILNEFLSPDLSSDLSELISLPEDKFVISDDLWVASIFSLLMAYNFEDEQRQDQVITALTALYNARVASYALAMQAFNEKLGTIEDKNDLLVHQMESIRQRLHNQFWRLKPGFSGKWIEKSEQVKPPLVPLSYMEYVPGKPIVIPKKMVGKDKRVVSTDNVFKGLRKRYEESFNQFVSDGLGLPARADSRDIIKAVEKFMEDAEKALDNILPGDLHTPDGLEQFVNGLFTLVPHQPMFTICSDLLREMVVRFPPVNLMIPMGYYKPGQLIENMDPRDAVTYANLLESWSYTDSDLLWLVDQLKPESFEMVAIKPIILKEDLRFGYLAKSKVSNLNRITARIAVKPLETGKGGAYPKLRYFTSITRRICVAEHYSKLFKLSVSERKNIGFKIKNSLLGLQKGDDFSANTIYENHHHRALVEKIRHVADKLNQEGHKDQARIFELMSDGYGIGQMLENETFLTCTIWSWASYSFKGGLKIPTPITTSVENRWFNHDFLEALYKELGYHEEEIMQTVFRLIHSGNNCSNLLDTLLPARPKDVAVVIQETTNEPSKHLQRYHGNPILEPKENTTWESKYVLNPGAVRIKDRVYLFYRAVGPDNVSHIGLAITDGYNLIERLPEPIFSPSVPEEAMGCEDPRVIIIGEKLFMLYTAYDGNIAQIAAASISVNDFLHKNFDKWIREGLAFKNIWDKDAILFPEKIKGKYIIYHRIEPSIWITYMNEIAFPCREKHAIIIGPRPGRMWDSLKIGAGAQPLKTCYGWLLIYHGVDYNYVYRLGVILVDLNNPQKVLYRSPNPV